MRVSVHERNLFLCICSFLSKGAWPKEAHLSVHSIVRPLWSWRLFMGGAKEAEILNPSFLFPEECYRETYLFVYHPPSSSSFFVFLFTTARSPHPSLNDALSPPVILLNILRENNSISGAVGTLCCFLINSFTPHDLAGQFTITNTSSLVPSQPSPLLFLKI